MSTWDERAASRGEEDDPREAPCVVKDLPARQAQYTPLAPPLPESLRAVLAEANIERLYSHQGSAISAIRSGRDIVVVTGTASGKTLCYALPIMEGLHDSPLTTALLLYPTKALAQDQLRGFSRFNRPDLGLRPVAGTYDGDTPQSLRRKLRDAGNVILTNPDMLHQGILPNHARWSRFLSHLRYVVIDELHAYRGVFGSHLANVVRRLRRLCRHYGSDPVFIACSATIANPGEHAERIVGRRADVIDEDGSPRGPKRFCLINPPLIERPATIPPEAWRSGGERASSLREASRLLTRLVRSGRQTIAFVRTRLAAEVILRDARHSLARTSRRLPDAVAAYRGGYLPEERREIERRLAERDLLAVASTNALELGIDIGSLDACIIVGFPGTIASLWQQAGRAGRSTDGSEVYMIAQNSPIDQYLMAHADYLFGRSPEHAVVDPDNPHIVIGHLRCAANELPLDEADAQAFGPTAMILLDLLEDDEHLRKINGKWYWARSEAPAPMVSLRTAAGAVFTIQSVTEAGWIIGTMDEVGALSQLHRHAVYLHNAETYLVTQLDIEHKIALVEKRELDYYTQSIQMSQIRIDETVEDNPWHDGRLGFGDVTVVTTVPMFKKVRFHSRESLGFEPLELPSQSLETVAFWLAPRQGTAAQMLERGLVLGEALQGVANVLLDVAPLFVMCDASDIGVTMDASSLGCDALFLYDKQPGGMGFARRCVEHVDHLMEAVRAVIDECTCDDGCPSCVGSAVPAFAMTDMDSSTRGRILSKEAARELLALWLG